MKKLLPIFAVCATIALVLLTGCPNVSGGGSSGGGGQEEKIHISGTMSLDVSDDLLEVADITVVPYVPKTPSVSRAAGGTGDGPETLASTHWQKSFYGVSKSVGFVYYVKPKSGIVLEERTYEFAIVKNVQATTTKGDMTIESKSFIPEKIVLTGDETYVPFFITGLEKNNNCFILADDNGKMSEKEVEKFDLKKDAVTFVPTTDDEVSRRATKKAYAIGSISGSTPSFAKSFSDRIGTLNSAIDTADFIAIAKDQTIDDAQVKSILKAGLLGKHIVLVEPTAANIADFWEKMNAALTTDFIKEVVKDPSIKNVVGNPFYASVKRMKGKTSSVFKDCLAYKVHKNGVHTVLPEAGLNARDYGRFADSIIESIEEEDDDLYPHLNYPLGPANDASLPDVMNAQKEEYTFKVPASNYSSETVKVQFFIWQVYSFDENADYYLVQETVTMQNSDLLCGPGNEFHWYTNVARDAAYGPYMQHVSMDNVLSSANNIYSVAPNTTSGSSSYTEGFSWNLGGNLGFNTSGATGGISGGVSYNNSTSRTVADLQAKYRESTTSPHWDYEGHNEPDHYVGWDGIIPYTCHTTAPNTYKSDVILNNNWVWRVTSPSGSYSFDAQVWVDLHYFTFDEGLFSNDYYHENLAGATTDKRTISMSTPSRTMDNYLMYFDAPGDWDGDKKDKFGKFLEQYFKLWKSNIDIYSIDESGNQEATKDHFAEVMAEFENNTQLFKTNGYTGAFTFRIKNTKESSDLATKDLTIN